MNRMPAATVSRDDEGEPAESGSLAPIRRPQRVRQIVSMHAALRNRRLPAVEIPLQEGKPRGVGGGGRGGEQGKANHGLECMGPRDNVGPASWLAATC